MRKNTEMLREKLNEEIAVFRNEMTANTAKKTYETWYKIGFVESYYELLTLDSFMNDNEDIIQWLLIFDHPLNDLYDLWLDCDDPFSERYEDMFDWLIELRAEMVLVLEKSDLLECNEGASDIKVSTDIRDCFKRDGRVPVQFADDLDLGIEIYVMIDMDDTGIRMKRTKSRTEKIEYKGE